MYRFFVPAEQIYGEYAEITGDDVNHIRNVLRMGRGEKVVISAGQGSDYYCIIREIGSDRIVLDIEREEPVRTELPVSLVLFQSLPKSDKMEQIVQKAVELGVSEIVPMQTRRSVVRLDEKKAANKRKRWQAIAEAAAKQSGRGFVPNVHEILPFGEALKYAERLQYRIIPYELFDDMKSTLATVGKVCRGESAGIFIGPEGGFERGEVEQALERGAEPVSLGRRILRTETAGPAILSVLMFCIEGGMEENGSLFG